MLLATMSRGAPHSYTLKKVSSILDTEGFVYKVTHIQNDGFYSTGCRVSFPNTDVILSVQTNPGIAGPNFAQTAVLNSEGILYIPSLGYDAAVIDHEELEPLMTHIRELKTSLDGRNAVDFPDSEVQLRGPAGGRRRPEPPSPPASQPHVEVPSSEIPLSEIPESPAGSEVPEEPVTIDVGMSELMSLLLLLGPPDAGTPESESLENLFQILGIPVPDTEAPPS